MKFFVAIFAFLMLEGCVGHETDNWVRMDDAISLNGSSDNHVLFVEKRFKFIRPVIKFYMMGDCNERPTNQPMPGVPVIVQGKKLDMTIECIQFGTPMHPGAILYPTTDEGRRIILGLITNNENLSITMPSGLVVNFENKGGRKAVRELQALNDNPI